MEPGQGARPTYSTPQSFATDAQTRSSDQKKESFEASGETTSVMVVLSVDLIEESFETRWYGLAQRERF